MNFLLLYRIIKWLSVRQSFHNGTISNEMILSFSKRLKQLRRDELAVSLC